jgi:methionyl-tRNA synthetase
MVGKEITRFHAVIWPAMLMAAGLPLPRRVSANGWWTVEGEKMSKSLGNVLDAGELAAKYGVDQIRYFLLREKPFGADGTFRFQSLTTRINVELANDLGNLVQRTLSLVARNCEGRLPGRGDIAEADATLLAAADALPRLLRDKIDRQLFHEALDEVWKVVRAANAYIDHQAPWALRKTDLVRMAGLLPFMPASMGRLLDQIGAPAAARDFASLAAPLPDGTVLPAPQGIFPRLVETEA